MGVYLLCLANCDEGETADSRASTGRWGASGAYFGQDTQSERIIDRLLNEQLSDGGWNCEAANGSTRSSFSTTICVLEALPPFLEPRRQQIEQGLKPLN